MARGLFRYQSRIRRTSNRIDGKSKPGRHFPRLRAFALYNPASTHAMANPITPPAPTLAELAELAQRLAVRRQDWIERVRLRSDERWFERIEQSPDHDVWVISWLPGQTTGFHDHGGSSGAFAVALGTLEEHRADTAPATVGSGQVRTFGPRYAHDVRNVSTAPAISIHVYSPPLTEMNRYQLAGDGLVALAPDQDARPRVSGGTAVTLEPVDQRTVRQPSEPHPSQAILGDARARLLRLLPAEAHAAVNSGAVLVDIRPEAQRAAEGESPARSSSSAMCWSGASIPRRTRGCRKPAVMTCRSFSCAPKATRRAWPRRPSKTSACLERRT